MHTDTAPNTDPEHIRKEALQFLTTLVMSCQERGGYTLDDAVSLQSALTYLQNTDTARPDTNRSKEQVHIECVCQLLLKSQSQGNLTLQEAWTTYNAMAVVSPQNRLE